MSIETATLAAPRKSWTLSLRARDRLLSIASPVGLLLLWEICARVGFIDTRFFPAPSSVISALIEMVKSGALITHTAVSLQRLAWGTLLGGAPALVLGIVMGLNRPVRAIFDPLIAAPIRFRKAPSCRWRC
jgi:ABC-type nitrate/sulfonate/bicarbonate transport system permease component